MRRVLSEIDPLLSEVRDSSDGLYKDGVIIIDHIINELGLNPKRVAIALLKKYKES